MNVNECQPSLHAKLNLLGESVNLESYSNIHVLNDFEILIVPNHEKRSKSVWKFNLRTKKFIKWVDYPTHSRLCYPSSSLNNEHTKLYIFGENGYVYILDLNTSEFTKSQIPYHDGSRCRSIFANGRFNIFGGYREANKSHFIWDEEQKHLRKIQHFHEMGDIDALMRFAIAYIKSKNVVYFMDYYRSNWIYLYDLNTNKCIRTGIDRKEINIYRAAVSLNEKYILGFYRDEINVIDLEKGGFLPNTIPLYHDHVRTRITYAYPNISDVCIKYDWIWIENVAFGYIRRFSTEFPKDIARLILRLFVRETIFILSNGQLWSGNVDEIIAIAKGEKVMELSECVLESYF
eukprot:310615_1